MKTLRRMMYGEVLRATAFVALAFLALFFFFDLMDAFGRMDRGAPYGYHMGHGTLMTLLQVPGHIYELMPIAALIGTIYVMARLAESSEFTIMRTSGLEPHQALFTLLTLGMGFVAITFTFGDYVAPEAVRLEQHIRTRYLGDITSGRTGAWLKDRQGGREWAVNVGALAADGRLKNIRLFEFDTNSGQLLLAIHADGGQDLGGAWQLEQVLRRRFATPAAAGASAPAERSPAVHIEHLASIEWPTELSADMISAALLSPERMQTIELFSYINHLKANGQSAQRYEIQFWRKVFYPLSCLVMMVLALPFAYLHFRSGHIAAFVFLGVLVGISFFLLNNVFGHIGNLHDWTPWMAAAAPGALYTVLSMAAFVWLVLRR